MTEGQVELSDCPSCEALAPAAVVGIRYADDGAAAPALLAAGRWHFGPVEPG